MVTCAVIKRNGFYLCARRAQGKKLAGYWEFPGGKVEDGESLFQCIEREILEELHCRVLARKIFDVSLSQQKQKVIELHAIECDLLNEEPKVNSIDHDLLCWTTPLNIYRLHLAPADIPFLKKLQQNKNHILESVL